MFYIGSGHLSKIAGTESTYKPTGAADSYTQYKGNHGGGGFPTTEDLIRRGEERLGIKAGQEAGAGAVAKTEQEVLKKAPWSLKKKLLVGGGAAAALGLGAYGLHRALSD